MNQPVEQKPGMNGHPANGSVAHGMRKFLIALVALVTAMIVGVVVLVLVVVGGRGDISDQRVILEGQACNTKIINKVIVAAINEDQTTLAQQARRLERGACLK